MNFHCRVAEEFEILFGKVVLDVSKDHYWSYANKNALNWFYSAAAKKRKGQNSAWCPGQVAKQT